MTKSRDFGRIRTLTAWSRTETREREWCLQDGRVCLRQSLEDVHRCSVINKKEERTQRNQLSHWPSETTNRIALGSSHHHHRRTDRRYYFLFCRVLIRFRLRSMPRQINDHREEDVTELEPERILVHKLVDSSKAQRTKAVERLKAWINARTLNPTSFFAYEDLIKVWKGLYYNMWMADKPVMQVIRPIQRCSSHWICITTSCLGSTSITSVLLGSRISSWWSGTFVHRYGFRHLCSWMVGNRSMASEQVHDGNWLDRTLFLIEVLCFSSSSFVTFSENRLSSWKIINGSKRISRNSRKCWRRMSSVPMAIEPVMVGKSCFSHDRQSRLFCHLGLKLHLADIYLEELAKVGGIALKPKRLLMLLSPFFNIIKSSDK